MGKGKAYPIGERNIILKVVTFFDKEKQVGSPIIPIKRALDRASEATGVCIRTLRNIKNETKNLRITPTPSTSYTQKKITTPKKYKPSNKKEIMVSNIENITSLDPTNLCMSCLCMDQSLLELKSGNLLNYYLDCIREVSLSDIPKSIILCWQCEAMLRKAVNFKEQIKESYGILQTCTNENYEQLCKPARLTVYNNAAIDLNSDCNWMKDCNETDSNLINLKIEQHDEDVSNQTNVLDISDFEPNKTNSIVNQYEISSLTHTIDSDNIKDRQTDELMQNKYNKTQIKPNNAQDSSNIRIENERQKLSEQNKRERESNQDVRKRRKIETQNEMWENSQNEILTVTMNYEEMLLEREKEKEREVFTKTQYKCDTCIIGFDNPKLYNIHVKKNHSPDIGNHICLICSTLTSTIEASKEHYKTHFLRYECKICKESSLNIFAIEQHYFKIHGKLRQYNCENSEFSSEYVIKKKQLKTSHITQ